MRHVQLKHIGSTAVQCSCCTCASDGETLWQGEQVVQAAA